MVDGEPGVVDGEHTEPGDMLFDCVVNHGDSHCLFNNRKNESLSEFVNASNLFPDTVAPMQAPLEHLKLGLLVSRGLPAAGYSGHGRDGRRPRKGLEKENGVALLCLCCVICF